MKFYIHALMNILISFIGCLYFPWWSIAVFSFLFAFIIFQQAWYSFLSSFVAIFLLWGLLSWWISNNNHHILAHKVSLIILKTDSPLLLILLTAVIGGIIAGLAAFSGSNLRRLIYGKVIL